MKVKVNNVEASYTYDYWSGQLYCNHEGLQKEEACCSQVNQNGYVECGCHGQDEYICPNPECTGIEAEDVEKFYDLYIAS